MARRRLRTGRSRAQPPGSALPGGDAITSQPALANSTLGF